MALNVWQIDAAQMTPFYNIELSRGLALAGCDVTYVASRYPHTELTYPQNIDVQHHYFKQIDHNLLLSNGTARKILRGLSYPLDNWTLLQKIKTHKPDIVHFQWSRLPQLDLLLIKAIQAQSIPVIHTVHDVVPLYQSSSTKKLFDIYRQCDALIIHSVANKQTLLDTVINLDETKIFTLPLIEASFPIPENTSKALARSELGIAENKFVVIFQGNIKKYKGVDILYDAIKSVQHTKDILWLIVGRANDAYHQDLLNALAQHPRTIVVDDYISNENMWKYFLAADIAIFPYRHIFQSAALITAMGFALPVVTTDVGSFPETIDGNGIIVPKENPDALRDAVLQLKEHPNLEAMGQTSLALIEQHHRADKIGRSLQDIYKTILNRA